MNKKINAKVEAVSRFFADSKASNHPINEHPVSKAEEYVRNLYFDMLCVVAQYECNDIENAFTLIKRIMSACENVQPLEEYIRRSMELTTEKASEFIKQCKDNNLCEIFFVDSLLLSCSNGTPNAKQVAFLSQFGDMLGFDKADMTEIAKFAVAILEQDSAKYQELLNENNANIQICLLCYAKEFVSGLILQTSRKLYYYSKNFKEYKLDISKNYLSYFMTILAKYDEDVEKAKTICYEDIGDDIFFDLDNNLINMMHFKNYDEIRIENIKIELGGMYFSSVKNLIFENCHVASTTLYLKSIDKVTINNCIFKWDGEPNYQYEGGKSDLYYYNRAIQADLENSEVMISNTKFSNFSVYSDMNHKRYEDGKGAGAVFCATKDRKNCFNKGIVNVIFKNCEFIDICTDCSNRYYTDGCSVFYTSPHVYYYKVSVENCYFSNCKSTGRSQEYLFGDNFNQFRESNNKLVNSSTLYAYR